MKIKNIFIYIIIKHSKGSKLNDYLNKINKNCIYACLYLGNIKLLRLLYIKILLAIDLFQILQQFFTILIEGKY